MEELQTRHRAILCKQESLVAALSDARTQLSRQQSCASTVDDSARAQAAYEQAQAQAQELETQAAELQAAGDSQGAWPLLEQASTLRSGSLQSSASMYRASVRHASDLEAQAAELQATGDSAGARPLWKQASQLRNPFMQRSAAGSSAPHSAEAAQCQQDIEALEEQLVQAQVRCQEHMCVCMLVWAAHAAARANLPPCTP